MNYNIHLELQEKFPFLEFLELPQDNGKVFIWAIFDGSGREALRLINPDESELSKLNALVKEARDKDLCICSNCHKLHKFNANVMYAYYCAECEKNVKYVAMSIRNSRRPNYYE